ncbi:MAG: hypothetical protein ACR2JR_05390 [Rubrobacteraceae bacterium]
MRLEVVRLPTHQEWEPSAILASTIEELSLKPGTSRNEVARLKPYLEEALEELACLERQRDISDRERMRAEALWMLLESIEKV